MVSDMNYVNMVLEQERTNVCIDFDGVIHNDYNGFGDGTIYGNIIDGAKEAIEQLAKNYNIVIFTAKAKSDRPLVNGKTGVQLIWEWLREKGLAEHISEVTAEKPRGIVYIDDKAIRFTNWNDALNKFTDIIENIKWVES